MAHLTQPLKVDVMTWTFYNMKSFSQFCHLLKRQHDLQPVGHDIHHKKVLTLRFNTIKVKNQNRFPWCSNRELNLDPLPFTAVIKLLRSDGKDSCLL